MPVYARTAAYSGARRHPRALLLIVAAHAALLAAVMSAKMDLPQRVGRITEVILIPEPLPPPPDVPQPKPEPQRPSSIETVPSVIPVPQPDRPLVDPTPLPIPPRDNIAPMPQPEPLPLPNPVRIGPRFATPASALRPPYPDSKRRLEEEAVLRLKLTIDPRGRVVAVDPVGAADPVFLAAARKHLLARWRYQPATEGGRAVASSTVITLRFELND
ncbi:energy transducer TonB [Sphingomonas sp.]|uniref:energy transducer TonB n=1 Tax=Sphingomonas sp. TaxID=28214 RepID=UPI00286E29BF|nr:energy transducer TonB [Sphingomonas sp.]